VSEWITKTKIYAVFAESQEQININILFIGLGNKIQKANSSIAGARRKSVEEHIHSYQTNNEGHFLEEYEGVSK
jgi:hypothetical protein